MQKLNSNEVEKFQDTSELGGLGACLAVCAAVCLSSSFTLTGTAVLSGAFTFL